jgi:hypothetical protein
MCLPRKPRAEGNLTKTQSVNLYEAVEDEIWGGVKPCVEMLTGLRVFLGSLIIGKVNYLLQITFLPKLLLVLNAGKPNAIKSSRTSNQG